MSAPVPPGSAAEPAPLRVVIADDEAPSRKRLRDLLHDCSDDLALALVGEATDGERALAVLAEVQADVILLDIRMPDMDGVEVARRLQKLTHPPAIIFTTAYDSYAVKAFDLSAADYLLKPVRRERLVTALRKVLAAMPGGAAQVDLPRRTHLTIPERGRITRVALGDVIFLRADLRYVEVHTRAAVHLLEESLVRLEQEFVQHFVRIHRNCLVSRDHILGFERVTPAAGEPFWEVILRDHPHRLPVSRRQQSVVRAYG